MVLSEMSCIPSVSGPVVPLPSPVRWARAPDCKSLDGFLPSAAASGSVAEPAEPADPVDPLAQARCRSVLGVVEEMILLVGERKQLRRDRRRLMTHVRQIAMYVSHVVLQISLTDIGIAFGRDRTTVSYSCHVVEDRRDDPDFDAFLAAIERVISVALGPVRDEAHG